MLRLLLNVTEKMVGACRKKIGARAARDMKMMARNHAQFEQKIELPSMSSNVVGGAMISAMNQPMSGSYLITESSAKNIVALLNKNHPDIPEAVSLIKKMVDEQVSKQMRKRMVIGTAMEFGAEALLAFGIYVWAKSEQSAESMFARYDDSCAPPFAAGSSFNNCTWISEMWRNCSLMLCNQFVADQNHEFIAAREATMMISIGLILAMLIIAYLRFEEKSEKESVNNMDFSKLPARLVLKTSLKGYLDRTPIVIEGLVAEPLSSFDVSNDQHQHTNTNEPRVSTPRPV